MVTELRGWTLAASIAALCGLSVALCAQAPPAQKPTIKEVGGVPIASIEGADNYRAYCAVCHGAAGKGDGPAAPAMKAPVPDLTTIARRNKGQFDAARMTYIIRGTGRTPTPAHGVEEMPIWGDVFKTSDKARDTLRITNLVKYLESIQAGTGSDSR